MINTNTLKIRTSRKADDHLSIPWRETISLLMACLRNEELVIGMVKRLFTDDCLASFSFQAKAYLADPSAFAAAAPAAAAAATEDAPAAAVEEKEEEKEESDDDMGFGLFD